MAEIYENSTELAKKICKALNIPINGIRGLQIKCPLFDAPIVTLEKIPTETENNQLRVILEEYILVPKEQVKNDVRDVTHFGSPEQYREFIKGG